MEPVLTSTVHYAPWTRTNPSTLPSRPTTSSRCTAACSSSEGSRSGCHEGRIEERILMGNEQRVIAILGAGGALGAAVSRQLAGESLAGLVLSDISGSSLEATIEGMPDNAGPIETVLADVSDLQQVEAVIQRALDSFGHLDVLVSNAGVLSPNGRIHNLATEDWERAFRVNIMGPVNAIRAAVPAMREQKSGSIILTASVSGLTAWSHASPYCVTKAAVIHLSKVAAVEYARD